jgi:acyl-CoA dehydrogenase
MNVLNVPCPDWMIEDLVLLEEQARRLLTAEFAPHVERWSEEPAYPRDVWSKTGEAGLPCAGIPEEYGGAGGSFANEAVIDREFSLAGLDSFGGPLHSGIVAPYILRYGTEEQNHWIGQHIASKLDTVTASMAKYWITDIQGKIIDRCLQLFGGYGYMEEYPISRMYRDARVMRIYAGTNEIMKVLIARSL